MTPDTEAFVRLAFQAQQPLRWIGAELIRIADGEVEIAFPMREDLTSLGSGMVMGGLLATVADVAAGLAIISRLQPPRPVMTIDFTCHQIAPANGERIACVGKVERIGKTIAIASAEAFSEKGQDRRLCTRLTATFAIP
ncbi:MAG: PaaI family thioesterase [Caulobacterales bacterium]